MVKLKRDSDSLASSTVIQWRILLPGKNARTLRCNRAEHCSLSSD